MSPKRITAEIVRRYPELKSLPPDHLRLVKKAIEEAIGLSSRDVLSREQTGAEFRKKVPDSGNPSAALRAYRKRLELTQRELAKKCGIPQPHIAAMESGARPIGLLIAKKLALALGIDFKKLI